MTDNQAKNLTLAPAREDLELELTGERLGCLQEWSRPLRSNWDALVIGGFGHGWQTNNLHDEILSRRATEIEESIKESRLREILFEGYAIKLLVHESVPESEIFDRFVRVLDQKIERRRARWIAQRCRPLERRPERSRLQEHLTQRVPWNPRRPL